ncbi:MAG TPA: DUF58 domain-containing protein [Polyangiaceae bacterium]|nr:DUF58 domain-containing protein [Polyangiaceae bacterium]
MQSDLSRHIDWAALGRLRLSARRIAEGAWVGLHPSHRRGAGLEFAGHRSYVPGDDLRWLDQRALMRHGRPLIKQFETETERTLRLVVDASASMDYRSDPSHLRKLDMAALIGAALSRIAVRSGDRTGLDFMGGVDAVSMPVSGGMPAFERMLIELVSVKAGGSVGATRAELERALLPLTQRAPRGTLIVVLSDLLELGDEAPGVLGALGTGGRQAIVVQVLDPLEASFALEGPVRLQASEGSLEVETNASLARASYLEALAALQARYRSAVRAHGGELLVCRTDEDAVGVVRRILRAAEGRGV